jgi:HD-like signal output (HDOD) protein
MTIVMMNYTHTHTLVWPHLTPSSRDIFLRSISLILIEVWCFPHQIACMINKFVNTLLHTTAAAAARVCVCACSTYINLVA